MLNWDWKQFFMEHLGTIFAFLRFFPRLPEFWTFYINNAYRNSTSLIWFYVKPKPIPLVICTTISVVWRSQKAPHHDKSLPPFSPCYHQLFVCFRQKNILFDQRKKGKSKREIKGVELKKWKFKKWKEKSGNRIGKRKKMKQVKERNGEVEGKFFIVSSTIVKWQSIV